MTVARKVSLDTLTELQVKFYRAARGLFREKVSWTDFEEFAFHRRSPLWEGFQTRREVIDTPLYRELVDMWIELGVQQGKVASPKPAKKGAAGPKSRAK